MITCRSRTSPTPPGVSHPIVYEHYGSKDGLYLAFGHPSATGSPDELATALDGIEEPRDHSRRGEIEQCTPQPTTPPEL
jgi:hypothetical protein